ncbi:hypothetical protein AVEN_49853-1 [Araneus ventricosus]|uniref:Uncharacterized protein n=1 Tax=Araneus ventricosus TaxID=182803 RepID=A0A4Y2MVL3_ARAVE|nr:hypothetical protein AVEN_49853-1 [Araneus ventricosus]
MELNFRRGESRLHTTNGKNDSTVFENLGPHKKIFRVKHTITGVKCKSGMEECRLSPRTWTVVQTITCRPGQGIVSLELETAVSVFEHGR